MTVLSCSQSVLLMGYADHWLFVQQNVTMQFWAGAGHITLMKNGSVSMLLLLLLHHGSIHWHNLRIASKDLCTLTTLASSTNIMAPSSSAQTKL